MARDDLYTDSSFREKDGEKDRWIEEKTIRNRTRGLVGGDDDVMWFLAISQSSGAFG